MTYFSVGHNSAYEDGWPEISEILTGVVDSGPCPECESPRRRPVGDLRVRLASGEFVGWPDVIACGDYPCLVVSAKFIECMRACKIRLEIGGRVAFEELKLSLSLRETKPEYFWIDGWQHYAGEIDFDASGFVDVHFCPTCNNRVDDVKSTYYRQHTIPPPPVVIDLKNDTGYELFTTNLSPTAFFGTQRVLECARKHHLTNLAFRSTEGGAVAEPVKY